MKKNLFMGIVLSMALVLTTVAFTPQSAEAKNFKNNGNSAYPGNSLFGRSHNPHFMYKWGNEEFEDFDELIEYLRELIMNRFQHRYYDDDGEDDSEELDVRTRSAIDIDEDEATLRGRIYFDDEEEAEVWFEYGTSMSDLDEETDKVNIDEDDDNNFTEDLDNLNDDTRYYFRAVAKDSEGDKDYGSVLSFRTDDTDSNDSDEPEADTLSAENITNDTVDLRGTIDMNDFKNGTVFFVYGTDEEMVEDVDDDYDTYGAIDEDGDNLQRIKVDSDLDSSDTYEEEIDNLDDDTTYYFAIGVGYENDDNDDVLELGDVQMFTTD